MRKLILLFISLLIFVSFVFPKSRTSEEALQLVSSFINVSKSSAQKAPSSVKTLNLTYISVDKLDTLTSGVKAFYYVYNVGTNNGFVIVSGDDRANTILGYSDSGSFDSNQIPDNLKYWLSCYEKEIKSLSNLPESTISTSNVQTGTLAKIGSNSTTVSPFTSTIKWDQGAPYNNLCPVINTTTGEKAVTGCVATAMAQVMKYYNWPVQGIGSNSYTSSTNKIALSVDFSKTQYDWLNMANTYSSSSTAAQNTAVATLMYQCGVAVNMDYDTSSGAVPSNMAKALIDHFGYDQNLQHLLRDYYTKDEWISLLKTELDASRPVLYDGQATDGGHQFVCDGYDSNNLFHFNWGWSGVSNGYFEISALNPNDQGIGSSAGGYNSDQGIVVGLQKPTASSTPRYIIFMGQGITSSAASVTRAASLLTITIKDLYNMGINTFSGSAGLALYNDNGLVQVIKSYSISSLLSNYGYSTFTASSVVFPTAVADGTYKLYFVYKASSESSWQISRSKVGTPNYLNVTATASNVTYSVPTNAYPQLTINSINVTGNIYQNKTGRFSVSITNNGGEYNSAIELYLKSTIDQSITNVLTENVNIASGETKTLYMYSTVTVAPGQYTLSLMYDPLNSGSSSAALTTVSNVLNVTVLAEPTALPALTLSSAISFPNSSSVDVNNAILTAVIKNTNGYFDNKLTAFIFPVKGGTSLTYIGYQDAIIDTNEEATIKFNGAINLDPGQYQIAVYYYNSSNKWTMLTPSSNSYLNFTLTNVISAIPENKYSNHLLLYPNPATDNLYLKSDDKVYTIRVFNMMGQQLQILQPQESGVITVPVESLSAGTYLLQVETDNASTTSKFIKR